MEGQTFGRWTALSQIESNKHGQAMWLCRCVCGTERPVIGAVLRRGSSLSCGCLQKEKASETGKQNLLPNNQASKNLMLADYQRRSKERGRYWGLSRDQFEELIQSSCFYCGAQPDEFTPRFMALGRKYQGFNGIDRLDSNRGYETDNVVPCCSVCNYMKGAMPVQDFLSHIARIKGEI